MFQAIQTIYRGPTDTRGSRILVRAECGRMSVPYNYALNPVENHEAAAQAFIEKHGLGPATWVSGNLPLGGYVFVCMGRAPVTTIHDPHES